MKKSILTLVATALLAVSAHAQTIWIGNTAGTNTNNNDYNVAANWNPADVPDTNTEVASFDASQANIIAAPWLRQIDTTTATINGLIFNSGAVAFSGNSGNTANVNFADSYAFRLNGTSTLSGTTPYVTQSGAGQVYISTLAMNAGSGLTLGGNGGGLVTINSFTGASGTVTKSGNSTYQLASIPNTSGIKYNITGGQLRFLGSPTNPGSLVSDFFTLNGGRLQSHDANNRTLGANAGILLGDASTANGNGTIGYNATGNNQFDINGIIANNTGGAGNLVLIGAAGTSRIALNGANTYTGTTTVKNTNLVLNYATSTSERLSNSAALKLDGGRVFLTGHASTTVTETTGGLTLGNGLNSIICYSAAGPAATTLDVGAISRTDAGVLGFQRSSTNYNLKTSTTNAYTGTSGAILGGYATVSTATPTNGTSAYSATDWAQVDGGGNIIALASYDNDSVAANANTNINGASNVTVASSVTINSLASTHASSDLVIDVGQTLTVNSGGVLYRNASGTGMDIGTTVGQGAITSGNGKDLVFWNNTAGSTPVVKTVIANNGGAAIGLTLAFASAKSLELQANNTFTGDVNIFGGILMVGTAATADVGDGTKINIGNTGPATSQAQLRFNSGQVGDKTLAQDITITAQHGLFDAAVRTAGGSFGNNGFDLNLDGNIALETVTAQVDGAQIYVLDHTRNVNSSVRIGGATANAKTITGSSVVGQHSIALFGANSVGFQNNTLAGGITDLTDALTINSKIQDGTGGSLGLLFDTVSGHGGMGVVVLNGNNTFTGAGAGSSGSQSGTTVNNNIILVGHNNALSVGPITMGRITGAVPSNQKQGLLTNGAYTIANNIGLNALAMGGQAAANGITTFESWIGGNTANTSTFSGRIDWMTPSGVPVTNTAYITGGAATVSTHALVLSQVAGGRSNFTGVIATDNTTGTVANAALSPVIVASGGNVSISNANNSYVGQTIIRNGALLVGANAPSGAVGALGSATSAIQLGDTRAVASTTTTVKAASVGTLPGTVTFNTGGGANVNGLLTWTTGFTANDNAWDGQTLLVGDYVLLKDQTGGSTGAGGAGMAVTNPAVNGIYKVLNVGATTAQFERVATADAAYGTYVDVSAGNVWGGKRFYQGYGGTGTAVTINNTPLTWMVDDTTYAPTLLTDGAVTVGRAINVNAGATGTSTLGGGTDHNSTISGGITLGKALTVTSVATGTNKTTLSGVIDDGAGSFAVTKTGAGRLEVTNANTYDGGTTISLGTLLVNNGSGSGTGTGAVSVASGATLGGTGSVAGAVTVNGTLSPGASVETLASGALTFNTGSTFAYEVDSSVVLSVGADLQKVSGSLSLSGTVTLTFADLALSPVAFSNGTTFTLINYTGSWNNGVFTYGGNAIADGGTFSTANNVWTIDYNATSGGSNFSGEFLGGNYVNITASAIPEPSTWALLAGSLTTVMILRRRRRA